MGCAHSAFPAVVIPLEKEVIQRPCPSSRSHTHTTHESTHYTTLHRYPNPFSCQCSSHKKMPNESEFETVISEADVEAGVMPIPQANANAQQAGAPAPAPAAGGWSLASLSGLQKYFDLNASELKDRLMALCMPWKGKSLYDMVNNKPDLYMPLWMTFFSATVFCFLWIMFTGKETLPILHAGRSMCLYLLWLGLSAAALWGSSSFVGAPTGIVASVSYNAYVTLLCEIPCLLFSWSFLFSFLFCLACTGAVSFFNLYKRYTDGNQAKGIAAFVIYVFVFVITSRAMRP